MHLRFSAIPHQVENQNLGAPAKLDGRPQIVDRIII